MNKSRKKRSPAPMTDSGGIKDFLDMIAPSVIDFKVDHFLCGNTYRCVWALREYPTSTDEQAILRHLGEMDGVTIRIYTRQVTASEEKRIIHNAANRNRMSRSSTEDLQQTVTAEANLQDVVTLVSTMHRNREPLLHCAVFLELTASSYDALKLLQTDVLTELVRSKLNVDRLLLRQREGFVSAGTTSVSSLNESSRQARWLTCTRSTTAERQIPTAFILARTSTAPTFWWISISGTTTKLPPAS